MSVEEVPKQKQVPAAQGLKDWSGPISTIALRLLELTSDISKFQKDLQNLFNAFRQLEEFMNMKLNEIDKRLPAVSEATETPPPLKSA